MFNAVNLRITLPCALVLNPVACHQPTLAGVSSVIVIDLLFPRYMCLIDLSCFTILHSQPTHQPLSFPTNQPTTQPVMRPSSQPSFQPAMQPSGRSPLLRLTCGISIRKSLRFYVVIILSKSSCLSLQSLSFISLIVFISFPCLSPLVLLNTSMIQCNLQVNHQCYQHQHLPTPLANPVVSHLRIPRHILVNSHILVLPYNQVCSHLSSPQGTTMYI